MSIEALAILGGFLVVMWRLQGVSTAIKILRAEVAKGSRLTLEEEEAAAFDEPPQGLDKKA